MSKEKIRVTSTHQDLIFDGFAMDAARMVDNYREMQDGAGMEGVKLLNDFMFSVETALQDIGYMDDDFNFVVDIYPQNGV